jgi:hypothetical protein
MLPGERAGDHGPAVAACDGVTKRSDRLRHQGEWPKQSRMTPTRECATGVAVQ